MQAHIEALSYTRGTTNTAQALDYVQNNMFSGANGDRTGVANIAVILTDGGSNDKEATFRCVNVLFSCSVPSDE